MNLPWIATADQLPPDNEAFIGWWPDIGPIALTAKRNGEKYITAEGFEPECAPTHWLIITPPELVPAGEPETEQCPLCSVMPICEFLWSSRVAPCPRCKGTGKVRKEGQ